MRTFRLRLILIACTATALLVPTRLPVGATPRHPAQPAGCPSFVWPPADHPLVDGTGLDELSGIQSSIDHPGVLWSQEDGGNGPHVYAFNRTGAVIADITLSAPGVGNFDWEAIGLDPNPQGRDRIVLGDIGDNKHYRTGHGHPTPRLFVFTEPSISASRGTELHRTIRRVRTYDFRYYRPDGTTVIAPRNAEALFVAPQSHDVYVITKDLQTVAGHPHRVLVTRLRHRDLHQGHRNRAIQVASVVGETGGHRVGAVGADVSRDGRWIVMKNYSQGFLWHRRPHQSIVGAFRAHPQGPCHLRVDAAEAIAFAYRGGRWTAFDSVREDKSGIPPLRTERRR